MIIGAKRAITVCIPELCIGPPNLDVLSSLLCVHLYDVESIVIGVVLMSLSIMISRAYSDYLTKSKWGAHPSTLRTSALAPALRS